MVTRLTMTRHELLTLYVLCYLEDLRIGGLAEIPRPLILMEEQVSSLHDALASGIRLEPDAICAMVHRLRDHGYFRLTQRGAAVARTIMGRPEREQAPIRGE